MNKFENIPEEIKNLNNWVLWKLEYRNGEKTKPPYQIINGKGIKSNDPKKCTSYDETLNYYNNHRGEYKGIGFMFEGSGYTGIDIDHHIGVKDTITEEEEHYIIDTLDSYTETSQSGAGAHVIVRGSIPQDFKKKIEMYSHAHYFAMTGDIIDGRKDIEDRQLKLDELYKSYSGKEVKSVAPVILAAPEEVISKEPTDYEALLDKALTGANGLKIRTLYIEGDIRFYNGDDSRADLGLCDYLAYYFDNDFKDIDYMFRKSKLYRPKWDEMHGAQTYGTMTINKTLEGHNKTYQDGLREKGIPSVVKYYDLNDYGNGQRLVDTYKNNIRYCNELKVWMIFNSHRWVEDKGGVLERLAKKIIEQIRAQAFKEKNEKKQKLFFDAVSKAGNIRGITGMVKSASTEKIVRIGSETFDRNKYLLNFKNGTFDLNENIFKENKSDDYITKLIDINYDSTATCPRWEQFINEIMGNNEGLIKFVQRAIGYSLTGSCEEQKMFICYGSGSNGKTIMMETLRAILNDYSRNITAESLMAKESTSTANGDIARLKGARFVTAKETKEGRKLDEALIKEVTGADTMTARYLYKDEFEFIPELKLWLATNYKPEITGQDEGIWRRLILIPFNVQFTNVANDGNGKKDKGLAKKLKTEMPGIINWCIKGCAMWNEEGLSEPKEVLEAVEEYRSESDGLQQFIDENLKITPGACITNKEITELYNRWNGTNINTTKFVAMFKAKAKKLKLISKRRNYGTVWEGIGKTVHEDSSQENPFT